MLRSTFYTFTTALRGMNVAQKGLDITGQNISNAKTPGYTRQRADIYAAVAGGYGDRYATKMSTMAGQGAIVDSISQIRDQFLDVRFRRETAVGSEDATKLGVMNDLERFFNEIEKSGLQDSFNTFVTRLQQLSRNVESPEFDNLARDAAQSLAMQLNHYAHQLKSVREGQEYNLREVDVPEINDILKKIGELNKSIREVQANGGPALELKDERNLLLDKLSSHVDINVKYTPNYMAGDLMVEDVTISLIGKSKVDGSRIEKPIVYNDAVSKFSVETPGADGTNKSYVSVDASELPAKEMRTQLEGYLRVLANANNNVMYIKGKAQESYKKYLEFFQQNPRPAMTNELDTGVRDLINKIFDQANAAQFAKPISEMTVDEFANQLGPETLNKIIEVGGILDKKPGGVLARVQQAVDAHVAASENYNKVLNRKVPAPATPAEIKAAKEAFVNAAKEEQMWQTYAIGLINIRDELKEHVANLNNAKKEMQDAQEAIKQTLATEGVTPEFTIDPADTGNYNKSYYTFKRGAAVINDKDGNPVKWEVGGKYQELKREDLESTQTGLGIDFTKIAEKMFGKDFQTGFDFENLDCKGALRGSLKMLNESGVFDNGATSDTVRGTGYYEKLLDTLADKLATTLNNLNDRKSTLDVKEHLFQIDPNSKDKGRFTAENIRISKDWLEGKYKLTASQEVQPEKDPAKTSARNENLLRMISTITQRLGYDTGIRMEQNKYGLYVDKNGDAVADSIDEDGNYVKTSNYADGKKVDTPPFGPAKKIANRDGILYDATGTNLVVDADKKINTAVADKLIADKLFTNGEGTIIADNKVADGYTLSFNPADNTPYTPPRWVADAEGLIYTNKLGPGIANFRDAAGNYIYRTRPDGVGDVTVANKDGIPWDPVTSTFTGTPIEFSTKRVLTPAYTDATGTKVIADGRDAQGNYTLRFENGVENKPPKWVADPNGVLEYKDGNGLKVANHRDDEGNYIMRTYDTNGKIVDKMVANKDGVFYQKDALGNLKKDTNGLPVPEGTKIYDDAKKEVWQKSFVYNGSFKEYLTNLGNTLALDISSTKGLVDNHKTVIKDVQDQRDSISKVNIDEEGVNMLLYQKAYNASARLMTALDEAIDKIINGMGVVGR